MDKGLFANDGSFMERFKQMQQEQEKAATAAASSAAPKPANPKPGFAVAANKRPFELKKAGPVATGGKLAFSLKKAKVAIAPVFAPEDEEEDAADVDREEPAKRQKSVKADTPAVAAPTGAVGNHLFICCCYNIIFLSATELPFLDLLAFCWFYLSSDDLNTTMHAIRRLIQCCALEHQRYINIFFSSN